MTNTVKPHVCPWWVGFMLISPVRRLLEDAGKILGPHVRQGMTVLEVGPAMGYYSLPLARMVGESGRVICVDIQQQMLNSLGKRAKKAALQDRIATILASGSSLNIQQYHSQIDFALVFAVIHEVPDPARVFGEVHRAMKAGGTILFAEPRGHVKRDDFERSVATAKSGGFEVVKGLDIWRYYAVLLKKSA